MDIFALLMWPIKWAIEAILVGFHWVITALGGDPASGLTWVLSIVGLVLVIRSAMIPLTVRQIVSSRKSLEIQPEIQRIQKKYRGKKDQFSREAMQRETMEAYKKAGTNPFASCLPLLIQMPIFLGLVQVLTDANNQKEGVGGILTKELATLFSQSTLFGVVPLHKTMEAGFAEGNVPVIITAVLLTAIMCATQFYTQLQIMTKNQTPAMKESPMYRQQRILLYIIPVFLLISAWLFPLGTMFYWLVSNIYTLVQQLIIINKLPTPGSEAALAREARMARKRQRMGLPPVEDEKAETAAEIELRTQRQQPRGKKPKSQREG